jgi:hypothetical protein
VLALSLNLESPTILESPRTSVFGHFRQIFEFHRAFFTPPGAEFTTWLFSCMSTKPIFGERLDIPLPVNTCDAMGFLRETARTRAIPTKRYSNKDRQDANFPSSPPCGRIDTTKTIEEMFPFLLQIAHPPMGHVWYFQWQVLGWNIIS